MNYRGRLRGRMRSGEGRLFVFEQVFLLLAGVLCWAEGIRLA